MVEKTRTLDFKIAFALGLGTMIAAGIFSLSGRAVYEIGSSAVIAFVIAALIASITAASYSEFASIYSENGGGYLFSSRTFDNEYLLFGIGASLFMGYCATTAFYLGTMDHWVEQFVFGPALELVGLGEIHLPGGVWGILTALLLGGLNAQGTEESGTFQLMVTGAKVAVLFAFIGGAVAYAGPAQATATFATGFEFGDPAGIVSIAALAFITFFGFSAIAASAGEIIEPRKTVPKAIAASIVTVTVLYTFVIVAMVNAPVDDSVLRAGETAMGTVAASFMGPAGQALIVAGAIFSMVSASNASILAASSIGDLMGRQGQGPRSFSRIHQEYNTPFWSIVAVTGMIVALIAVFVGLFPAEGGLSGAVPFALGLEGLTGFANMNLLAPLAVVNVALIVNRRRFPDIERPFSVPASPWLPIVGVLANLALITNLPPVGIAVAVLVEAVLVCVYLLWGGAPDRDELINETVAARQVTANGGPKVESASVPAADRDEPSTEGEPLVTDAESVSEERYEVLVPIERPDRAIHYARLAADIGRLYGDDPVVRLLNVTEVPDQTGSDTVVDIAVERADRIEARLETVRDDLDATVLLEGHISRDVAFDIVATAREESVDRIVMGYPEDRPDITESVEYRAPCDVVFASRVDGPLDLSTITIGVGGGPHHDHLLDVASLLARRGTTVHVVNVEPTGTSGTPEDLDRTLERFDDRDSVEVHAMQADDVADALIEVATDVGGPLVVGASRNRVFRRFVFGSNADKVVRRTANRDVPVLVYASETGLRGRVQSALFTPYRFLLKLRRGSGPGRAETESPS
ncbi:amino acid permease [Halalkalicoccus jeotgali]|uniref:Amino acid permease-associated protein n=1 Tax=Halalkalicoccus jeotgali (strain DSM 18796 / CECT 7217 / JCM 14584 / KCTC 4019 / B3) TaxID=795797 RepID=D8J4T5_HALJB|nr:amino acid permease [Halalkalicoccus jeotgali]ADJ15552.1 amino acid permease-associated region [Halalkalicoccus jeotgali B3]ELY36039.1 amino acid permease-associated protein [Halalkalicoccus jeotgali B3]